jgi:hypothetical protein
VCNMYIFVMPVICNPGGADQMSSHPPEDQKIRVRIPPGCKVFRENIHPKQ